MRPLPLHVVRTVLLLLILSVVAFPRIGEASSEALAYNNLKGTWQVFSVNVDTTLSRKANYNYNDPRLLGRLVMINDQGIMTDFPEASACLNPNARPFTANMDNVISTTMGKSKKKILKLNKFDLPADTTRDVQVWWIACGKGDIGPDTPFGPNNENWIASVSQDRLALRWYDNTILLLKLLSVETKPNPSFSCAGHLKPVEQQICLSLSLSELDNSVSRAYRSTVEKLKQDKLPELLKAVKLAQKKWVMERNKCGADEPCLAKSMHRRLDELVTQDETY